VPCIGTVRQAWPTFPYPGTPTLAITGVAMAGQIFTPI
jgi:hypothetical protein